MADNVRAFGHAIHPMLMVIPLGLLSTAVVFDIIYLFNDNDRFAVAAGYNIAAGVIGGVLAAIFGWADWRRAIPDGTRAKGLGLQHGLGNTLVLVLFAISWILRAREDSWEPGIVALILSFLGIVIAGVTGWMGGELVERLGISVHKGASADAPSSLKSRTP
jgi:uncharacterized membrane protein